MTKRAIIVFIISSMAGVIIWFLGEKSRKEFTLTVKVDYPYEVTSVQVRNGWRAPNGGFIANELIAESKMPSSGSVQFILPKNDYFVDLTTRDKVYVPQTLIHLDRDLEISPTILGVL